MILACALVIGTHAARSADAVHVVEERTLKLREPRPPATHALSLHAYVIAGTSWDIDSIAGALPLSAALLAPCGIALTNVKLAILDTPRAFRDYATSESRALVRALRPHKPALFFVEDTRNDPAFDAEAIGVSNARTRPELANTVWIAFGARDLPYAIAHELVHVLADSGEHSEEPLNLMRDETAPAHANLTPEQCRRVRSRGASNDLLAPLE